MEYEKTRFDDMTQEEKLNELDRINAQIQVNEQEMNSILSAMIEMPEHPAYLDLVSGWL